MVADTAKKQRSQSVASAIFDPKEGTLLGRTAGSWATILTFYLFYYSFLGLLFWGTIQLINVRIEGQNEGQFPAINTRLDEPGLSVFPHATVIEDENNEELTYAYGKAGKKPTEDEKDMIKRNEFIVDQYLNRIVKSTDQCAKADVSIKKAGTFLKKNAAKGLTSGKPYVVLRVNRRANWAPISVQSADEKLTKAIAAAKGTFTKDTVYFTCEESKAKNGVEGFKNLKKILFSNPTGRKFSCGLKGKTAGVGCIPARFYNKDSKANAKGAMVSKNPKYTGFNPFTVEGEVAERKWGDALVQSCWPFTYAQVFVKDPTKPVGIQCQIHVENINSEVGNPQNYGWVKFGFQGKSITGK